MVLDLFLICLGYPEVSKDKWYWFWGSRTRPKVPKSWRWGFGGSPMTKSTSYTRIWTGIILRSFPAILLILFTIKAGWKWPNIWQNRNKLVLLFRFSPSFSQGSCVELGQNKSLWKSRMEAKHFTNPGNHETNRTTLLFVQAPPSTPLTLPSLFSSVGAL